MKKNFKYAILSAIALVGAVSFSACQSSDDLGDVNPTYDGESVKTSFTISIGDVKGTPTRMGADAVQKDKTFKGMTDIYLFPFISSSALSTSSATSESYIHLADFAAFDDAVKTAQGKIYKDVNLSVGVNKFVFYGATATANKGNGELKASYLKMDKKSAWASDWAPSPILTTSTLDDIKFDLVPIQRGKDIDDVKAAGSVITSVLNGVDAELTTQIASATGDALTELQKIQKTLRNDVSTTATPEYKAYAGSSKSIGNLISMLYGTVKNLESKIGATVTNAIVGRLSSAFTLSGDGSASSPYTASWATDPNFPGTLNVPDGAVSVKFADGAFAYVEPSVDGLSVPSIDNYTYPARLYYRANTTSMIKNTEYLSTLANSQTTWEAIKTKGAYTEAAVKSDTRSVIMKDQVQYAVGRLDVQVRVKPSVTIVDNSKDAPQPVTVPGGGYKLTGVLIGGQKQVDWEFKPISSATEMIIWDSEMASDIYAVQQEAYSSANYTLALETAEATSTADGSVNIALEFENTGNDFCGVDHNVIPAGTKFYLVAKLVPGNATQPTSETLNQVFKQDYITTVKLTISEESLKNAYNVVPDLRSPKLEFGLSVDLEWLPGLTFEMDFQ